MAAPFVIISSRINRVHHILSNIIRSKFDYRTSKVASQILSQVRNSSSSNKPWQITSAVCVQRIPVITQNKNEVERQFSELLTQKEFEHSFRSDHELRHEADMYRVKKAKEGEDYEEDDEEEVKFQTAQDFEDLSTDELNQFKRASRITDADTNGDKTSLRRALDKYLYLTVKQKLGKNSPWVFPQGAWQEGETLRQTAERVLSSLCGQRLKSTFLGLAPVGFHKYKYPAYVDSQFCGAKVFFFKCVYREGDVEAAKDQLEEYQWLTRVELTEVMYKEYFSSINRFLVDDENFEFQIPKHRIVDPSKLPKQVAPPTPEKKEKKKKEKAKKQKEKVENETTEKKVKERKAN